MGLGRQVLLELQNNVHSTYERPYGRFSGIIIQFLRYILSPELSQTMNAGKKVFCIIHFSCYAEKYVFILLCYGCKYRPVSIIPTNLRFSGTSHSSSNSYVPALRYDSVTSSLRNCPKQTPQYFSLFVFE